MSTYSIDLSASVVPKKTQVIEEPQWVEYATNVGIFIGYPSSLFPSKVTAAQVSLVEGAAKDWALINDHIRFLTPNDPGKDTYVKFKISLPDKDVIMPVRLHSSRPLTPMPEVGDGPDPDPNDPQLIVTGMGSDNVWSGNDITLSLTKISKLSSEMTVMIEYQDAPGIDLKNKAKLNVTADKIIISAADFQQALRQVPYSEFSLNVQLIEHTVPCCNGFEGLWNIHGYKPTKAILKGQLVDLTGKPSTTSVGTWLAIRGMNTGNGTRQVVPIQANGTFTAKNLISGDYMLEVLDVNNPKVWIAVTTVQDSSTVVPVNVLYDPKFVKKN